MKRWIVASLEGLCGLLRHPFGCKLADWSYLLDVRWNTGEWGETKK